MPRRERARLLLHGLAKLLAVVGVAGVVGALLGIGLSKLTADDEAPAPASASTATSTSAVAAAATAGPASEPAPPAIAPLAKVRVRVLGAVLHAASTTSGARRQRARIAVRVRAENTGTTAITLARPTLTAAGTSVETDPRSDAPTTSFGPLAAGKAQTVTLRFETAGALTAALTSRRRGQLRIAGRTLALSITVGGALPDGDQGDTAAAAAP